MVRATGYTDSLGAEPPSPAAGTAPTRTGAEPGAGCVTSGSGYVDTPPRRARGDPGAAVLRVCRRDVLFVMGAAHTIQISHSFFSISPLRSSNQTKSPDSSKNFTSEKGSLPETMNPCRDFTFAIDFMREMLSDSDNI